MRLSTHDDRDDELALQTIAAAAGAGLTVFDTARAYGRDAGDLGHNERLLARGLRVAGCEDRARIVSKGGMARVDRSWIADGRARTILSDCHASLTNFDGLPIDLYLIHAPDPRTPWRTSVRALARLLDEGLVRHVGVANVNRQQLDEALDLADITAVQVALSLYDDSAIRAGVVERCAEKGLTLIAHSPLGGRARASQLAGRRVLAEIATAHGATAAEVALAWLLDLASTVVAIPGARRPETARSAARAARLAIDERDSAAISAAFGVSPRRRVAPVRASGDVVLIMGIPGAGKTRIAGEYVSGGYRRLNRDEQGGRLRELADVLDDELASGRRRVVLDNTYINRAARSHVIDVANRHGVAVRCIWLDTPLAQAQVNLVQRLLELFGSLPSAQELQTLARREPGVMRPTSQMRLVRDLEPPSLDEGFAAVERVAFVRTPSLGDTAGVVVAAAAIKRTGWKRALDPGQRDLPHLVFDWVPGGAADVMDAAVAQLAAAVDGPVQSALCTHDAGPPQCWCRPPLPGLPLAFARTHAIDLTRSRVIGVGPAHRTLATTLGAEYVQV